MKNAQLIDSHCHLASYKFADDGPELDAIIDNAIAADVTRMVSIGTDLDDSPACVALADKYESVYAAVGIHPCSVHEIEADDWLDQIRTFAKSSPKVAAIGEIGLDYFHPAPNGWTEEAYRARQAEFFQAQLALAADLGLNVIVHQRDRGDTCWPDIQKIMEPWHGKLRAVFHCFIHDWSEAKPMVDKGHLISFTGIVTYKTAPEIQACATEATVGSFMVETDAPYLTPVPHRGKRCEPAHTRHTAERIAKLRGIPLEQLATETTQTAQNFFRF
jgi:TatD DNase family protein